MPAYRALLSGYRWGLEPTLRAKGTPIFLTYSFPTRMTGFEKEVLGHLEWHPFSSADKSVARYALKQWGDACGIRFIETKGAESEIRFSWLEAPSDTVAYAEFPEAYSSGGDQEGEPPSYSLFAGNVRVNPLYRGELDNNNSYKIFVFLHEIGHALGLKHPFQKMKYNKQVLSDAQSDISNTVMAYAKDGEHDYPVKLRSLDIQAIRALYGGPKDGRHLSKWAWNKSKQILTQSGKISSDTIHGVGAKDLIKGNAGNDKLYGYDGIDTLIGGTGNDTLAGGYGKDVFVFDAPLGNENIDKIVDLDEYDRINLSAEVFSSLPKGQLAVDAFSTAGHAEDANDHIIYDPEARIVFYDPDGNGPEKQILFLSISEDAFNPEISYFSPDSIYIV